MPAGIDIIEITSQGGDTESALEIGRLIRQRGYSIHVKKYCLSACAQWILPAAKSVTINHDAIVAMHMSATWLRETLRKSGEMAAAEKYSHLAEKEAAYYKKVGVRSEMLLHPYIGKQAICYISEGKLAEKYPIVASKYEHVIITNETYTRLTGQKISGEWPDVPNNVRRAMEKSIPSTVRLSVALETSPSNSDMPHIDGVPKCTNEQIETGIATQ